MNWAISETAAARTHYVKNCADAAKPLRAVVESILDSILLAHICDEIRKSERVTFGLFFADDENPPSVADGPLRRGGGNAARSSDEQ